MKASDKLKIVLTILEGKRPNVSGLGPPIFILKDVIEELKIEELKNQKPQ